MSYEMVCRHCSQGFVEMTKLLFHRCPGVVRTKPDPSTRVRRRKWRRQKRVERQLPFPNNSEGGR